jgi:peptidoglycan hydrolase CwlO-like protein
MKQALQVGVAATFLLGAVFASAKTMTSQPSAAAREIHRYVIVKGDTLSGSWDSEESPNAQALRARYGDHFAWFREGGRDYIITDADVLAELDKAEEPQKKVNASQADVNQEQARVNELQAKVNEHQKAVNEIQHEVNHRQDIANQVQHAVSNGSSAAEIEKLEAELRELRARPDVSQASANQMQAQVNEEQNRVNDEQAKVNEMQHGVNEEQHRVSAEFARRANDIFSQALEQGTAQAVK